MVPIVFLAAALAAHVLDLSPGITITGKRNPVFLPPSAAGPAPVHFYPEQAQLKGLTGEVTIRCKVSDPDAKVGPCVVTKEQPTGQGFGERAAALGALLKLSPEQIAALRGGPKGPLEGAEVIVPIHFVLEAEKPAPARAAPPSHPPAAGPRPSSPGS